MKYNHITEGRFISRPNRFIAYVDIAGKTEKVHVKNTGRCRELLTDHADVYLEKSDNKERSTAYDLIAVKKAGRMINMDSNAPNKAVGEWLLTKELFPSLTGVIAEKTYKNSRFDFYVETEEEKIFLEVKGVTLEKENAAYFPDAPSERAVKHVEELIKAKQEGYGAYIVFVIQMEGIDFFSPNRETQPAFAHALERAREAGVEILAYDCHVMPDRMEIRKPVEVRLTERESIQMDGAGKPVQKQREGEPAQKQGTERPAQKQGEKKAEQWQAETEGQVLPPLTDRIVGPLLAWYDRGRRILPWRENPTPYYVWLSEIMLQQTRVEAVKPYFDRFIGNVPDIRTLAGLEEEKLVKLWEGLGYYNRVRNLQKAAQVIMEVYGGRMPSEYEQLTRLPGIGSYTAGAIASIAYGRAVPAVDGNVLRVLARLRMDGADILAQKTKKRVETELSAVIPADRAGDFNQALMELGATVCLPGGEPRCAECPWEAFCQAHLCGRWQEFPKKKSKKARTIEEKTVLIIRDEEKAAFYKRPEKGLLAGMYGFPMLEGFRTEAEVLEYLKKIGLKVLRIHPIGEAKHIFSHKEWRMTGYLVHIAQLDDAYAKDIEGGYVFAEAKDSERKYAIPSAFAKYARYMDIRLGKMK